MLESEENSIVLDDEEILVNIDKFYGSNSEETTDESD
jgi:hypothetical protein